MIGGIGYFTIDQPLARWADSLSPFTNGMWQLVTRFGLSEWYLVLAGFMLVVYKLFTRDEMIAWRCWLVVACIGGSGLFVNLLKWIFGRYRPPMLLTENQYGFSFFAHGYMVHSFPSGHSATAAALTVLACKFMPRFGWLWLCMGLLIAVSRIFVGAHYASDVIVGWTVGLLLSVMACRVIKQPQLGDMTR
jgi:undecaprenyl-diphosphatase